jgi:hypothetical protein
MASFCPAAPSPCGHRFHLSPPLCPIPPSPPPSLLSWPQTKANHTTSCWAAAWSSAWCELEEAACHLRDMVWSSRVLECKAPARLPPPPVRPRGCLGRGVLLRCVNFTDEPWCPWAAPKLPHASRCRTRVCVLVATVALSFAWSRASGATYRCPWLLRRLVRFMRCNSGFGSTPNAIHLASWPPMLVKYFSICLESNGVDVRLPESGEMG